tara:strand:+ start:196 stop:1884 length:1689 start_codon:yes stop_codon:yes gene_type:complete
MSDKSTNFLKLFKEKKYSLIVSIIENKIPSEKKTSALLNLSGVCRMLLRKVSSDPVEPAINDFREAYLKETDENKLIQPIRNFINSSVIFFDVEHTTNGKLLNKNFFDEIYKIYELNKNLFEKNLELMKCILKVFRRSLDIKSYIFYLDKFARLTSNLDLNVANIFFNNYLYNWSQTNYLENSKKINDKLTTYPKEKLFDLTTSRKKKINLAFISSDIRAKHSVTYFLRSILINYDKTLFNIFIYHNNTSDDDTTKEFEKYVHKTVHIFKLKDVEVINTIRQDEIDVIVDLNGFSSDHRLNLFKNRLAPIQVSWCGYTNTTGLKEMDYLIVDKNLIMPKEENLYSEKLIYLSDIWNCHCGYEFERSKNELPLKKNNFITFGSFNNYNKINDNVIEVWSSILKKVKNSKLFLKSSTSTSQDIYKEKFKKNGVLDSITFERYNKEFVNHLEQYKQIDISLDTFPWNGVTTSFESIWMNVPMITMDGHNFGSRCGASINKNLNLLDLVGNSKDDYVSKAVALAENSNKLEKIRNNLFNNALNTPLFDKKKFSDQFFSSIKNIYNE